MAQQLAFGDLVEVALLTLGQVLGLGVGEAHLDGLVAFLLGGLDLGDEAGARLDDGHGDDLTVGIEDLGHAQLLPKNS
ncbi:hypothetical protein D3C87_1208600 [compost metagenome]